MAKAGNLGVRFPSLLCSWSMAQWPMVKQNLWCDFIPLSPLFHYENKDICNQVSWIIQFMKNYRIPVVLLHFQVPNSKSNKNTWISPSVLYRIYDDWMCRTENKMFVSNYIILLTTFLWSSKSIELLFMKFVGEIRSVHVFFLSSFSEEKKNHNTDLWYGLGKQ